MVVLLLGCPSSERSAHRSDKHPLSNAAVLVRKGEQLFRRHCARCHPNDATGAVGPPIHGVTRRYDRDTLRQWIENPMQIYRAQGRMPVRPGYTPMPRIPLQKDEVQAILAYLYARDRHASTE